MDTSSRRLLFALLIGVLFTTAVAARSCWLTSGGSLHPASGIVTGTIIDDEAR